ncbi:unnamed protein product [Lymnaea stagnalis]|uniref:U6 snRNA phosphodiesterase n=1 Tax=Lymnaea stagnalis TaxID=6523 RepID=A0AAV2I6F6_LYMST
MNRLVSYTESSEEEDTQTLLNSPEKSVSSFELKNNRTTYIHENESIELNKCNTDTSKEERDKNDILPNNYAVPRSAPVQTTDRKLEYDTCRKRKLNEEGRDDIKRLYVPDSVQAMFQHQKWIDKPSEHGNRVRSFPHLEGNWATHVFIPVEGGAKLVQFVQSILRILEPVKFQAFPEFHISLSRTVTIRHHWIEPLVDSLRDSLRLMKSFMSDLLAIKLFTNDEKTRTFVCLELSQDETDFIDFVKAVDKSFGEFKLPSYYKDPSFHISIGWCLGDVVNQISEETLLKAKGMLGHFVAENTELSVIVVQQICCRAGNKSFVITLKD